MNLPATLIEEIDAERPFIEKERFGETAKRAMVIRLLLHEALRTRQNRRSDK